MKKLLLLGLLLLAGCSTTESTLAITSTSSSSSNSTSNVSSYVYSSSSKTSSGSSTGYTKYTSDLGYRYEIYYENGGKLVVYHSTEIVKEFEFGKWELIYVQTPEWKPLTMYDYGDSCLVIEYYR